MPRLRDQLKNKFQSFWFILGSHFLNQTIKNSLATKRQNEFFFFLRFVNLFWFFFFFFFFFFVFWNFVSYLKGQQMSMKTSITTLDPEAPQTIPRGSQGIRGRSAMVQRLDKQQQEEEQEEEQNEQQKDTEGSKNIDFTPKTSIDILNPNIRISCFKFHFRLGLKCLLMF